MASATNSARNDESDLALTWSGRWTLTHRILAVNVLTLALVVVSIGYLDRYRNRLEKERVHRVEAIAELAATTADLARGKGETALLAAFSKQNRSRIRLYGPDGKRAIRRWNARAAPE